MTTERFDVVLQGSTLRGQDVAAVATELAKLIKRDTDFAADLLRGQSTKLKSGIDAATGARYVKVLERIGVAVRLEPETLEADADLSVPPTMTMASQGQTQNPATTGGARVTERVRAEDTFHGDEQQRHATGAGSVSGAAKNGSAAENSAPPSVTAAAAPTEVPMEAFYKAAIGPKNQPFYLNYFSKAESNDGLLLSWHWPACFVTLGWLLYRKLYAGAIVYFIAVAVSGAFAGYWEGYYRAMGDATLANVWLFVLVVLNVLWFVLPPILANGIYYRHVLAKIHRARQAHVEADHQIREATIVGGTSWPAVVVGLLLYYGFVAGMLLITNAYVENVKHQAAAAMAQQRQLAASSASPPPAVTAAPSNPFADPDFGKTPEPRDAHQAATGPAAGDAQFNLGLNYAEGRSVPRDYAMAATWYRKAADQGNSKAQNNLASMYAKGEGVVQDYAEAVKWYRKAADQGNSKAQNNLASMYAKGEGVVQDYAEAVKWYRKAADQGAPLAQSNLGVMYEKGEGVSQDYAEAMKWYRKAADQGEALAQFNLGLMYATGRGVARDDAQAAQWYRRAADQGDGPGQYFLGLMYANGQGVPQDYVEGYKFINLALARFLPSETAFNADAAKNRDIVAMKMTPEQIAEAQRLAREWKPK